MSAVELIQEFERLLEEERERVFDFVLHSHRPAWARPKPPGYFANCYTPEEIEISNWLADQGPKSVVP
jgi:hypothetical protein